MAHATRVVIADDHPLVRRALAESLTRVLTAAEIAEVGSLTEATAALGKRDTDLLLLDLQMPGMNGLASLTTIRAHYPAVPILVVSANEDPLVMREVIEFGASGFLPKSSPVGEIGAAVAAILAGGIWLPEAASAAYLDESESELAAGIAELTPQQRRVLLLLTDGKSNKQIAFELAVTEATVKAHLSQIFRKLGVRSRTQAVIS
ncbi:MAG TPA: response regulator transcription factor, partial [Stellaceae bacterium]|nr:response regulator transcription factor [Stellaceae bacterium]